MGTISLRFQPLRIFERYVLRQVTAPLLTAMLVGLLILVAERLVIVLAETMGKKNSFSIVFELISYWLPHYAGLAGPVALYLGLLVGFSRLSRSSELDALLASGLGLHQLVRPLVILAALMCTFSLLMIGWMQPFALYAYRALINTVENVDVFYLAGGFGRHLNVESSRRIGLIPNIPDEKIIQVGNAAIEGACIALLSKTRRLELEQLVKRVVHCRLETHPGFFDFFVEGCQFKTVITLDEPGVTCV